MTKHVSLSGKRNDTLTSSRVSVFNKSVFTCTYMHRRMLLFTHGIVKLSQFDDCFISTRALSQDGRRTNLFCTVLWVLDPIYAGIVTTVQVLYLLEICCIGGVFIILYDEVNCSYFNYFSKCPRFFPQKAIVQYF